MNSTLTSPTTSHTADSVAERLALCLPELSLDRAAAPGSLAIDSLDFVTLLCAVDGEFGVRVSADEFAAAPTVDALFQTIATHANL